MIKEIIEKNKKLLFVILLFIFVFSDYLADKICKLFCYTDEFILFGICFIFFYERIYKYKNTYFSHDEKKIILTLIIIYLFGIFGNILSGYQNNIIGIIKDIIVNLKFFLPYVFISNIIRIDDVNKTKNAIINISKLVIIISAIVEILNLLFGFLGSIKYGKFGIPALTFGGHPYFSSAIIAIAVSFLAIDVKNNKQYIIIGLILSALTFRTKAYLFIALIIFSIIFLRKNIKIWKLIIMCLIMIVIGWNKFEYYFLDPNASRSVMLFTSFDIAKSYFPIGSGFGTFGSIASGEYYSDVYILYNLNNRYGFSKDSYSFVTDGGWAGVIGQFGFIGILGYTYMLIIMLKRIYKNNKYRLPIIGLFGYLLISSTNENAFTSNYTILYAISIAVLTNLIMKESSDKIEKKI